MLSVDPLMLESLRKSHRVVCGVDLYQQQTMIKRGLSVSSGTVTADRNQRARRSLSIALPSETWASDSVDTTSARLQVWVGADLGGSFFSLPVGVFRVDSAKRTNRGVFDVTATSLEIYIIEYLYTSTVRYKAGDPAISTMMSVIYEAFPEAQFEFSPDFIEGSFPITIPYDIVAAVGKSAWDVVETLAFIANVDVYCAPSGKFRIAPRITLEVNKPVATIKEGTDGVLITLNNEESRSETYNAVLAMGSSMNSAVPPVSFLAKDTDPLSPTRWGGPFGKKPRVLQPDEMLTSKALCEERAREELLRATAVTQSIDFSAIPNPALEPDDIVRISMLDGSYQKHLITSLTIPLGAATGWNAKTLSPKDIATLDPSAPIGPEETTATAEATTSEPV